MVYSLLFIDDYFKGELAVESVPHKYLNGFASKSSINYKQ